MPVLALEVAWIHQRDAPLFFGLIHVRRAHLLVRLRESLPQLLVRRLRLRVEHLLFCSPRRHGGPVDGKAVRHAQLSNVLLLLLGADREVGRLPRPDHVDARRDLLADVARLVERRLRVKERLVGEVEAVVNVAEHRRRRTRRHRHQQLALDELVEVGDEAARTIALLAVREHPLQLRHLHELLLDPLGLGVVPLVELVLHATHWLRIRERDLERLLGTLPRVPHVVHKLLQHLGAVLDVVGERAALLIKEEADPPDGALHGDGHVHVGRVLEHVGPDGTPQLRHHRVEARREAAHRRLDPLKHAHPLGRFLDVPLSQKLLDLLELLLLIRFGPLLVARAPRLDVSQLERLEPVVRATVDLELVDEGLLGVHTEEGSRVKARRDRHFHSP